MPMHASASRGTLISTYSKYSNYNQSNYLPVAKRQTQHRLEWLESCKFNDSDAQGSNRPAYTSFQLLASLHQPLARLRCLLLELLDCNLSRTRTNLLTNLHLLFLANLPFSCLQRPTVLKGRETVVCDGMLIQSDQRKKALVAAGMFFQKQKATKGGLRTWQ